MIVIGQLFNRQVFFRGNGQKMVCKLAKQVQASYNRRGRELPLMASIGAIEEGDLQAEMKEFNGRPVPVYLLIEGDNETEKQ